MNLQARLEKYTVRKLPPSDAEVLVLLEETVAALFNAFGDHFILYGGATLVLFYGSPRVSRDLDLLPSEGPLPTTEDVQAAVRARIQPLAEIFGLGQLEFRQQITNPDSAKHWVLANQKTLFSIDLTKIGSVLETQIVKKTVGEPPETNVLTPNANYLLLQKCETFLDRRNVKARDAFDLHLLLSREAQLDKSLRSHLEDFIVMKELDKESIKARIAAITPKLCTVELRPVLPPPLFEQLEKERFEPLRQSLRSVFSDWLAGGRR